MRMSTALYTLPSLDLIQNTNTLYSLDASHLDHSERQMRMNMARAFVVELKDHLSSFNPETCDWEKIRFACEKSSMFGRLSIMLELGDGSENIRAEDPEALKGETEVATGEVNLDTLLLRDLSKALERM